MTKEEIISMARQVSARFGLPAELIIKQIERESAFNPAAAGSSGEIGLMQIMPATGASMGYSITSLRDPRTNIIAGCQYMHNQIKMIIGLADWLPFKAVYRLALIAYNGGPGYVSRAIRESRPGAVVIEIMEGLKKTRVKYSWVFNYAFAILGPIGKDEIEARPRTGAGLVLALALSVLLWYRRK